MSGDYIPPQGDQIVVDFNDDSYVVPQGDQIIVDFANQQATDRISGWFFLLLE